MPQVRCVGCHRVPDVVIMEIDCSCHGSITVEVARDGGYAGLVVRGLQTCDGEVRAQLMLHFVIVHLLLPPIQRVFQLRIRSPEVH